MKLTPKQKRLIEKHTILRVWAAKELLKRLVPFNDIEEIKHDNKTYYYNKSLVWDKNKQIDMIDECIEVMKKINVPASRKKAARVLLDYMMGVKNTNDLLEKIAVVEDRNDPLVYRWRKNVIKRDGRCVSCGSEDELHAHHISHWADDPVNRVNIDNGIALCAECHSLEHPELENLLLSRGCS